MPWGAVTAPVMPSSLPWSPRNKRPTGSKRSATHSWLTCARLAGTRNRLDVVCPATTDGEDPGSSCVRLSPLWRGWDVRSAAGVVSPLLPVHFQVVALAESFEARCDEILDSPQVFLVGGLGVERQRAKEGPEGSRAGILGRRPSAATVDVAAGEKANCLIRSSGQGRGRTADLPPFRRSIAP